MFAHPVRRRPRTSGKLSIWLRGCHRDPNAWFVDQFANPANPLAHEQTTGPEIWEQMERRVDAVVCGAGSGGTVTGLSRFFARASPYTELILADPAGSSLASTSILATRAPAVPTQSKVSGECIPPVADLSRVSKGFNVSDDVSFEAARELLRKRGILAGSSTGTLVGAALEYCREQREPKRVVTFVCDSGNKYLSKMFDDFWMFDHGYANVRGQAICAT